MSGSAAEKLRLPGQGLSVIEVAELADKNGSHTKIIDFLKSDLETWLSQGGAPYLAKLVNITPISRVYGSYIYS